MAAYLAVTYVVSAGQNGPQLGSDEEEIVLLVYLVIDVRSNKVVAVKKYLVKPRTADINENILLEQTREDYELTEDLVKNGLPLETVIEQFDQYLRTELEIGPGRQLQLVTDGQLALRQCLHPESCRKDIQLPFYYFTFFDLRKEFRKWYRPQDVHCIKDMLDHLGLQENKMAEPGLREADDIARIVERLICGGHKFETPEVIDQHFEPGICSKNEEVDSACVARARGLPWQSSDQDIARFFRGLNLATGGVALCLSPQGRRNGEALVRFVSMEHRDLAIKRHKHHIGNRYIEVYKATGEDFVNVAGGNSNEAQAFLSRGGQVIIRMRGLPYDCTPKQVLDFFNSNENACSVMDDEDGVLFVKKPDGRATGDAFVLFKEDRDADKALSKHRQVIGPRYIELFRSTTAEVQQVLNRSMDPRTYEHQQSLLGTLPQQTIPVIPQQIITSGTTRDCIRLRGLPYEAQVEHILDFLGEYAKNIVFQGVHMVFNAQGQPSGEAFIQMDSEHSAAMAASRKHHQNMIFGKKQRYIEVFQCSGEDMNYVLTGSPALKALMSPGMLQPHAWPEALMHTPHGHAAAHVQATVHAQTQAQAHAMAARNWAFPPAHDGFWLMGLAQQGMKQHQLATVSGWDLSGTTSAAPLGGAVSAAAAANAAAAVPPQVKEMQQAAEAVAAYHPPLLPAAFPAFQGLQQPPGFFLLNVPPHPAAPPVPVSVTPIVSQPPPVTSKPPLYRPYDQKALQLQAPGPLNFPPPTPMGVKRSWEQAFHSHPDGQGGVKRHWQQPGLALPPPVPYQTATLYPTM